MVDPLAPEALRPRCAPESLPFATTDELTPFEPEEGQERALEALTFGLGLRQKGYNVFAVGETGIGRHTLVEAAIARRARDERTPDDFAYVHGFDEPRRPRLLRLPAGRARGLRDDLAKLVEEALASVAVALAADEHQAKRRTLDAEVVRLHEAAVEELRKEAKERKLSLEVTPDGFTLTATRDGKSLSDEEADALPEEDKKRIDVDLDVLGTRIEELLDRAPRWHRERRDRVRELERQLARRVMQPLVDEVRARYADVPVLSGFLDSVLEDLIRRLPSLLPEENRAEGQSVEVPHEDEPPALGVYRVNVLVDNADREGAPVVIEHHPTEERLFGRIDLRSRPTGPSADFTMIRAGALHRANGGYLVVDAHRLLAEPTVWERLKRVLRSGELGVEPTAEAVMFSGSVGLDPWPLPLDVKIVLIGERWVYYMLFESDPELEEHFKVLSDFDDDAERSPESELALCRLVRRVVDDKGLPAFDREAVARVIEETSRWADDAQRVSLNVRTLADLLVECAHFGRSAACVGREHVEAALAMRMRRHERIRMHNLRLVRERIHGIETRGRFVGQINGLSVEGFGPDEIGMPLRITAQVRAGRGTVLDIEREVDLSGPLHSKGVLILGGFLGSRYATDKPLSLHATLVIEQSYGGIDGDSASLAELCVLLSSLSDVPIRQDVAVTGSVDQRGQVQAVGGVNTKIEGFFDVCNACGELDGHGVIIPRSSMRHLMLRPEVVEAARAGRFRVWPVSTVEEALSVLTGVAPGQRNAYGHFPEGSINSRVEGRLRQLALTELNHADS